MTSGVKRARASNLTVANDGIIMCLPAVVLGTIFSNFLIMNEWFAFLQTNKYWERTLQKKGTIILSQSQEKNKEKAEKYLFPNLWNDFKWLTSVGTYSKVKVQIYLDVSGSIKNERFQKAVQAIKEIVPNCLAFTKTVELIPFSNVIHEITVISRETDLEGVLQDLTCQGSTRISALIPRLESLFENCVEDKHDPLRRIILISDWDTNDAETESLLHTLRRLRRKVMNLYLELINVGLPDQPRGSLYSRMPAVNNQKRLSYVTLNTKSDSPAKKKQKN